MKAAFVLLATIFTLAAAEPKLGIVKHGNSFEFSVIYADAVDRNSMLTLENYRIAPGTLLSLREAATNRGVILVATGLQTNVAGFLSITGLVDLAQGALPPFILPFDTGENFWTAIGDTEIPSVFAPEVTAVGTNGFDLFSSGIQQVNDYDEATFAGRRVEGDFDQRLKVEWVDPAGPGAKAGIMARQEMDSGKPRPINPEDPAQTFSRYVELFVTAPTTATGAGGSASHHVIFRVNKGDFFTETLTVTNDASPKFPDAWLRMQKVGPNFTFFRGTNGIVWEPIGTYQFPAPATNAWNVGASFSPQNDDLPNNLKRAYVAKVREFLFLTNSPLNITISRVANRSEVSWEPTNAVLQSAATILGQWGDWTNQANPQAVDFQGPGLRFFRLRGPN